MRAISTGLLFGLLIWASLAHAGPENFKDPRILNLHDKKSDGWTFGVSHGTTGFGLEGAFAFNDIFSVRAAGRAGNVSFEVDSDGIEYEGDIKLGGGFLFADITPFPWKGFVLSPGVAINNFEFESDARCGNPAGCKVGNMTFSPAQLGELSADMKTNKFAPYFGVGVGTPFIKKNQGFSIRGEIGLMFIGRPDVDVSSNSPACNADPACVSALRKEEDDIEDDTKYFPFYGVLNLIVGYTF